MISRRYLRVKTFQALYAYFQTSDKNVNKAESELFLSLERMYDLYLFFLALPAEIVHRAELRIEESKTKRLPSEEDLDPNQKLIENRVFRLITTNKHLSQKLNERKLSWSPDQDLITKFMNYLRKHDAYVGYMSTRETSFEEDQKFAVTLYKKIIPDFELMLSEIQDKSIFWGFDEIDFVLSMVLKSVKRFNPKSDEFSPLLNLYTDKDEDVKMVKKLFRKTIEDDKENSKIIAEKTKNWDVERIAMIDILLMKMALTELVHFNSVPVKVTLNEYIELSKWFSTPKSKIFINGVLDKLVADFKESGKMKKIGRGLLDA